MCRWCMPRFPLTKEAAKRSGLLKEEEKVAREPIDWTSVAKENWSLILQRRLNNGELLISEIEEELASKDIGDWAVFQAAEWEEGNFVILSPRKAVQRSQGENPECAIVLFSGKRNCWINLRTGQDHIADKFTKSEQDSPFPPVNPCWEPKRYKSRTVVRGSSSYVARRKFPAVPLLPAADHDASVSSSDSEEIPKPNRRKKRNRSKQIGRLRRKRKSFYRGINRIFNRLIAEYYQAKVEQAEIQAYLDPDYYETGLPRPRVTLYPTAPPWEKFPQHHIQQVPSRTGASASYTGPWLRSESETSESEQSTTST